MGAATTSAPSGVDLRVLRPSDARTAATLLAVGFAEEPGNVALLPDPEARRILLETMTYQSLRSLLPHGTVHGAAVDGELAAAALWHPPGVPVTSVRVGVGTLVGLLAHPVAVAQAVPRAGLTILRGAREGRALMQARKAAVAEASAGAAWHLAFLATAPQHRGKGLARALLDRQLRRCDEDGAAAWLETTDPVNPPIYERFGFETVTHVEDAAWLPGFWVMRREPSGR